jgi:Holliday junction resolvasome RuvABC endonuclease subunit
MIVLGFDPGTKLTGWALIETRGASPAPIATTFLAGGHDASNGQTIGALLASRSPDVVAIEKIAGFAFAPKGPGVVSALIASASVAGMIAEVSRTCVRRVVEMTARESRKLICNRANASDALVKTVVMRLVHGMPLRSNSHVRDAVVVAMGAAWHLGGRA